jgi:4-aminobutyrate aminotransferase-like enzyme
MTYDEALGISVRRSRPDAPVIDRGQGCYLFDVQGKAYLDMTGGSGAVNLGHQRPEVVETLQRQAQRLIHTGWNMDGVHRHAMIERLSNLLPYREASVMGAVTGAEAIEVAQKLARAKTGRDRILYFEDSFHGKTQGALSITSNRQFRAHLVANLSGYPSLPLADVRHPTADAAAFGCMLAERLAALRAAGELPAAAIIEPIQAAEGIYEIPRPLLGQLIAVCRDYGVISIFDEIYTGMGRTGAPFVANRELTPDLMVIGKSLGNGLPIAAVVGDPALMAGLGYAEHSSTFTFMPLACAVACTVLDIHIAERPWDRASRVGTLLIDQLRTLATGDPRIGGIRGRGLMLAFDVAGSSPSLASQLGRRLEAHGVLVRTGGRTGGTVKLTPPLSLSTSQVDEFMTALTHALREVERP